MLYLLGTGKSQLIRAIQHFFIHAGSRQCLRTSASTGTAACNVNGSTIDSLLQLFQDKEKVNTGKLQGTWESVNTLIIDEVCKPEEKCIILCEQMQQNIKCIIYISVWCFIHTSTHILWNNT